MTITAVEMVQVTCERCDAQSRIIPKSEADTWLDKHNQIHVSEDRRERMRLLGHECDVVDGWMDNDDSGGRVVCTCGYRSEESKLCWMDEYIDSHLIAEEKKLLDAWAKAT